MPEEGAKKRNMEASVGDRLHVHANAVGQPDKIGEITEVRVRPGSRPDRVGLTNVLICPCPDAVIGNRD